MRYARSREPDMVERVCGGLAILLLVFAVAAVIKGRAQWAQIPWLIWFHLITLFIVLAITPFMMWHKRGDMKHRFWGWIWSICLFLSAVISLFVRQINNGNFSIIHILSVLTIITVPVLIIAARRRDIEKHRNQARSFVIGALLIAGFFTFPFNRLLGSWLFG